MSWGNYDRDNPPNWSKLRWLVLFVVISWTVIGSVIWMIFMT